MMRCLFGNLASEPDFADSQLTEAERVVSTTSVSDLYSLFLPLQPSSYLVFIIRVGRGEAAMLIRFSYLRISCLSFGRIH